LLKTRFIGSVVPLMCGGVQRPLAASGAVVGGCWDGRLGLLTSVAGRFGWPFAANAAVECFISFYR